MNSKENKVQNNGNLTSPLEAGGNMFYGALPILFELARKLRDNQTEAEVFLWSQLENLKVRF